jgi:hypothetical protein
MSEQEAATETVTIERATLEEIRRSMVLLQINAEGCALNHYGSDSEEYGMPGWLIDTKVSLEELTHALWPLPREAEV